MIKEHDCIVLTQDLPNEGLQAGDVGTVVYIHRGGEAYEVEFVTLTGQTVAVATVRSTQLRPVGRQDIAHVRELPGAENRGAPEGRDLGVIEGRELHSWTVDQLHRTLSEMEAGKGGRLPKEVAFRLGDGNGGTTPLGAARIYTAGHGRLRLL